MGGEWGGPAGLGAGEPTGLGLGGEKQPPAAVTEPSSLVLAELTASPRKWPPEARTGDFLLPAACSIYPSASEINLSPLCFEVSKVEGEGAAIDSQGRKGPKPCA